MKKGLLHILVQQPLLSYGIFLMAQVWTPSNWLL